MKISCISNSIRNFNGLWGKTSRRTDFDRSLGVPKVEDTYYYYPFSDETQDEIKQVLKQNNDALINDDDGFTKYITKYCKLCTTLPLKKVNYENYINMKPSNKLTTMMRRVHYCVKDKYRTNEYGLDQVPAISEVVANKINVKG